MNDLIWNGINIPRDGPVPEVCTRFQGISALGQTLWGQILAMKPNLPWLTQVALDEADDWRRSSPLIADMGSALKLSSDQIDDLFRIAARI